ncbi:hypothetical protein [Aneurinibacillus tyrosinisolvens]|jgi:predicted lipid-binding transport protein (Tim44 family)|uniref:hypothetical protein n=1 Tax=Aneurinibacillus tyrosinisolvens TaxID=1443435 RepID=UPI00063F4A88|nr:hypothetical protein [Aneurinibacillus tyrosinisolvens]
MKKIFTLFLAVAVFFGAGGFLHPDEVSAKKSYRSGTKSYQPAGTSQNKNSSFNNSDASKVNKSTSSPLSTAKKSSGGFMKGLLFGGLAGMLLGGMLGNLGSFGAILGLLVNVLFVFAAIMIIVRLYRFFKKKRNLRESESWRR